MAGPIGCGPVITSLRRFGDERHGLVRKPQWWFARPEKLRYRGSNLRSFVIDLIGNLRPIHPRIDVRTGRVRVDAWPIDVLADLNVWLGGGRLSDHLIGARLDDNIVDVGLDDDVIDVR